MRRAAARGATRRLALVLAQALVVGVPLAACTGSLFQSKAAAPTIYLLSADLGAGAGVGTVATAATGTAAGTVPGAATGAPGGTASGAATGAAAAPAPTIPVDLAVLRPRIRKGLETDRIAVLYPDRHLDYFAGARWSGPLDEVLQDLAVQAFRTGASLRNVSADASAFPSGYWLELDVTDFQADYSTAGGAPTIRVHVTARLGGATDRRVLASFDAAAAQPASDNRMTAIVEAYEKAVDGALAQLVAGTTRSLAGASIHP